MDKINNKARIEKELQRIAESNDGVLTAQAVVEAAKSARSVLHNQFTWDDSDAAHQYRLWQARQLIRCTVTVEPRTHVEVRAYVSLTTDRQNDGGGYREMTKVLSRKEDRAQMLADALDELRVVEQKYKQLKELASVFAEVRKVRKAM